MITVTITETGDSAECECPESALLAARTMGREAKVAAARHGFDPHITFKVEGVVVKAMTLRAINREVG